MEATALRVIVLILTFSAERKGGHRRSPAIIGEVVDNCQTRSTVGTVDERIAKASVGGIVHFGKTGGTGGRVGSDRDLFRAFYRTFPNLKGVARTGSAAGSYLFTGKGLDNCRSRQGGDDFFDKLIKVSSAALDFNADTIQPITDKAGKPHIRGQAIDVRAKTDPLDGAGKMKT